MKKIFFLLLLLPFLSPAQTVGHLRYDTVRVYKDGGNATLSIENSTRNLTGAYLQNYANGRTKFNYALDSVWLADDSLRFRYGSLTLSFPVGGAASRFGVFGEDATAGEDRTFDIGSLYDFKIKHENVPLETWAELYIDKTGRTGMRTYWGGSDSAYVDVGWGEIVLKAFRYKMHDPGDPTSSNLKMVVWDSIDNYLRVTSIPAGSSDTAKLYFDSLGTDGISPVIIRQDSVLTSRRIDVTGGLTIDTTAEGGIVIDASGVSGAVPQLHQIRHTSGTTWTTPSDITTSTVFKITLVGGGGGGGGGPAANGEGAGGGAGGALQVHVTGLSPSTGYTMAIGAAGTGGATTVDGTAGTATTLTIGATTYTGNGGGGGSATQGNAGGVGGSATNGDINIKGQDGSGTGGTASAATPGVPGGSPGFGLGIGGAAPRNTGAGIDGTGYGSGGSGGAQTNTGGNGRPGIIIIEYIN